MLPFQVVQSATVFPFACVCGNGKGPLVDTLMNKAIGRIYLCRRCMKDGARALGFLPGERMEELEVAAGLLEVKDRELAERDEIIHSQENRARELQRMIDALTADLADAEAREHQAAQRLEEMLAGAKATLAAVSHDG